MLGEGGHFHSAVIKVDLHPHGTAVAMFVGCQQCLDHVGFSQHKGCTQIPVGFVLRTPTLCSAEVTSQQ